MSKIVRFGEYNK